MRKFIYGLTLCFFISAIAYSAEEPPQNKSSKETQTTTLKQKAGCATAIVAAVALLGSTFGYSCYTTQLGSAAAQKQEVVIKQLKADQLTGAVNPQLSQLILEIDAALVNSVRQGPDKNDYGQPIFHGFDENQVSLRRQKTAELENYVSTHTLTAHEIQTTRQFVEFLGQMHDLSRKFKWDVGNRLISTGHYKFFPTSHFDPDKYSRILKALDEKVPSDPAEQTATSQRSNY